MKKEAITAIEEAAAFLLAAALLLPSAASAAAYYVDFEGGSDSADGLSEAAPWQHSPGDENAAGTAASAALVPGDVVLFRGGTAYRGTVTVNASGGPGSPITFKGDGWGEEKAVIDGSEQFEAAWTRCESQEACGGNPGWEQIYASGLPEGATAFTAFYEEGDFLWLSQDPNQPDPFWFDELSNFRVVPMGDPAIIMTPTALTDPTYFTQADAAYWDGTYIAAWVVPNVIEIKRVTEYDPSTGTITYEALENELYADRDSYYAMLNGLNLIDQPGEYFIDESGGRIYLRPRDPANLAGGIYHSARPWGMDTDGHGHLVIEGLMVQRHGGGLDAWGQGVAITNIRTWEDPAVDVVVRGNEVMQQRSFAGAGAITLPNVNDLVIENNEIHDNQKNAGIIQGDLNVTVRGNRIWRCSREGIWFMGATGSRIEGNTVYEIKGVHSNGISVYQDSADIVISGNVVVDTNSPLTIQNVSNLIVYNNILIGTGENNVNEWPSDTTGGTLAFYNNVMVMNDRNASLNIGDSANAQYIVINNILDGGGCDGDNCTRSHNIYTGLGWWQEERYDWFLGEAEGVQEDLAAIFADPAAMSFRPLEGGPAVDTGLAVDDFSADIEGTPRPQGAAWDIGAYEFFTGAADWIVDGAEPPPEAEADADDNVAEPDQTGDGSVDAFTEGDTGEASGESGCGCRMAV